MASPTDPIRQPPNHGGGTPSAKEIFLDVLELEGEPRDRFIMEACAGFSDIRVEVEKLLAAHKKQGDSVLNLDFGRVVLSEFASDQPETRGASQYRLGRELGHGACAVVYHAIQETPVKREVAIKMISPLISNQSRLLERFQFEQRSQSLMNHPNIARVMDAGEMDGRPFLVMELVDGVRITSYCDGKQLGIRERLTLFLEVCNAISHAHQKGVIHRDIKPSNVLVADVDGKPVAKVIDFGVAKAIGELDFFNLAETRTGQLIGSPAYMSPEQISSSRDIDTRSDIYSLGVLLFELLSGQHPFSINNHQSVNYLDLAHLIQQVEPGKVWEFSSLPKSEQTQIAVERSTTTERLSKMLQNDLTWIVQKCLEKDRSRRYESVTGLSADISNYLNALPVAAGPPTRRYIASKWAQRNRGLLAAGLLITACVLLGLIGTSIGMYRSSVSAGKAKVSEQLANQRLAEAEAAVYRNQIARAELQSPTDIRLAKRILEAAKPRDGGKDLRNWEWGYLHNLTSQEAFWVQKNNNVECPLWDWDIDFSPTEETFAVATGRSLFLQPQNASPKGAVSIWSIPTKKIVASVPVEHTAYDVEFSDDGSMLAVSDLIATNHFEHEWYGKAFVWNGKKQSLEVELEVPDLHRASDFRFSPDGMTLYGTLWLSKEADPVACVAWSIDSGEMAQRVEHAEFHELSSDGTVLVKQYLSDGESEYVEYSADLQKRLSVRQNFDLARPESLLSPQAAYAFHCDDDKRLIRTNLETGETCDEWLADELVVQRRHPNRPVIAFHPNGENYATGGMDGKIRIWNFNSIKPIRTISARDGVVQTLEYSPSGRHLISSNWYEELAIWEPDHESHFSEILFGSASSSACNIHAFSFDFENKQIIACYCENEAGSSSESLANVMTGRTEFTEKAESLLNLPGFRRQTTLRTVAFDSSGTRLVSLTNDRHLLATEMSSGQSLRVDPDAKGETLTVAISGDGKRIAASKRVVIDTDPNNSEHVYDTATAIKVWDVLDNGEFRLVDSYKIDNHRWYSLALSYDGNKVAAVGEEILGDNGIDGRRAMCFDLVENRHVSFEPQSSSPKNLHPAYAALAFNRTGTKILVADMGFAFSVFDVESGQRLFGLADAPVHYPDDIAWNPDDSRIAIAFRDFVTIWDDEGYQLLTLKPPVRHHDIPFKPSVRFSSDGKFLAATQWNNTIRIWKSDIGQIER